MAERSIKHEKIKKAANTSVIVAGICIFIIIFGLFSCKYLISKLAYQNKVIDAQQKSLNQLQSDLTAEQKLSSHYAKFISGPINLIGGSTSGTGQNNGDNGKIILDALPAQYDFPELATSLQNLLQNQGVNIDSISGTDQVGSSQSSNISSSDSTLSGTNASVIPFEVSVDGPYVNIQSVVNAFYRSIRPMQIQTIQLSGDQSDITMDITAQTFYQPGIKFSLTKETIN